MCTIIVQISVWPCETDSDSALSRINRQVQSHNLGSQGQLG